MAMEDSWNQQKGKEKKRRHQKIAWQQGNYYTKDPDAETDTVWSRVTNGFQQTTLTSPIDESDWILKQRKTNERWIDCIREDVTQQNGDMQMVAEKTRDRQQWREFVQLHRRKPSGV